MRKKSAKSAREGRSVFLLVSGVVVMVTLFGGYYVWGWAFAQLIG